MDDLWILAVLKFAGLGIGLASTVWGLARTTTFADNEGNKRLTPAGHVAIALALGSFLVAGAAQGFETLAKQDQERKADLAAAERASREASAETRALRSEQRERQTLAVAFLTEAQVRAAAADARASDAEARVLSLYTAGEQRRRDLALSRDVNARARENLARTSVALDELQRVLQPIGELDLRLTMEIRLGVLQPRVAQFAMAARANPSLLENADVSGRGHSRGRLSTISVDPSSSLYPTLSTDPVLAEFLGFVVAEVHLISASQRQAGVALAAQAGEQRLGGITLTLHAARPRITYSIDDHSITLQLQEVDKSSIERTGAIVSIPDLEASTLAIDAHPRWLGAGAAARQVAELRRQMRPIAAAIQAAGRTYALQAENFRPMGVHGDFTLYAATPLFRGAAR